MDLVSCIFKLQFSIKKQFFFVFVILRVMFKEVIDNFFIFFPLFVKKVKKHFWMAEISVKKQLFAKILGAHRKVESKTKKKLFFLPRNSDIIQIHNTNCKNIHNFINFLHRNSHLKMQIQCLLHK